MNTSLPKFFLTLLVAFSFVFGKVEAQKNEPFLLDMSTEDKIKKNLPMLLGSSNQGTDFWLTFHPNHTSAGGASAVKIYITSDVSTTVTLEVPGRMMHKTITTIPDDIVNFELSPSEAQCYIKDNYTDDPWPQQVFPELALHLSAPEPFVVYGMSRYFLTTDGFLGVPTSGYGTDYIVHSWPDYTRDDYQYTSYVSIIGVYENTKVTFELGGAPTNYTPPPNSMKFGDRRTEKLNPGDVWIIGPKGDFNDVSGSVIHSNKPVSVISGNYRTAINTWIFGSRDYLIEHLLPVHTWGYKYHVTPVAEREKASMVRIYASQRNTTIYRDGDEWAYIKYVGGAENEGWITRRAIDENDENPIGAVVISADKQFSVAQFNPSQGDDGTSFDPFMMHLTPIAQYQKYIVFCTPGDPQNTDWAFDKNYMNLCYKSTVNGLMPQTLEYGMPVNGTVNWTPFNTVVSDPGLKFEESDITDGRYWKAIQFFLPDNAAVYAMRSEEPFAAYGYGFESADSYGYPLSAATRDLSVPDVWPPETTIAIDCNGNAQGLATEMPNADSLRSNFSAFKLIKRDSYNYDDIEWDRENFVEGETRYIEWELKIIDPTKDAYAVISMNDRAGNDKTFTIEHKATKFKIKPPINNWGLVAYNDAAESKTLRVINETERAVVIDSVFLMSKDDEKGYDYNGFTIDNSIYSENGGILPGYEIQPEEEFSVNVIFDPITVNDKMENGQTSFIDSVGVKAYYSDDEDRYCFYRYLSVVKASTGAPVISVDRLDFEPTTVDTKHPPVKEQVIYNVGNAPLTITGMVDPKGMVDEIFTYKDEWATQKFPVTIEAGENKTIKIAFKPNAEGDFEDQVEFISDSDTSSEKHDPILELTGNGIMPSLSITGYDWKTRRVHLDAYDNPQNEIVYYLYENIFPYTTNDEKSPFTITNGGTQELVLDAVNIRTGDTKYFTFASSPSGKPDMSFDDFRKFLLNGNEAKFAPGESKQYAVGYDPLAVGVDSFEIQVSGIKDGVPIHSNKSKFKGIGIQPEVATNNYFITESADFTEYAIDKGVAIVGDTENPVYSVDVVVTNTATSAYKDTLTIYDVRVRDNEPNWISINDSQGGEKLFAYDKSIFDSPKIVAPGDTFTFTAYYYPTASSENHGADPNVAHVDIITDAPVYATASEWSGQSITQGATTQGATGETCIQYTEILNPTITNDGDADLRIDGITFAPNSGRYKLISPDPNQDFPYIISSGTTLTLDVEFMSDGESPTDPVTVVFGTNIIPTHATEATQTTNLDMRTVRYERTSYSKINGKAHASDNDPKIISFAKGGDNFKYEVFLRPGTDPSGDMVNMDDEDLSRVYTILIKFNRNNIAPVDLNDIKLGDELEDDYTIEAKEKGNNANLNETFVEIVLTRKNGVAPLQVGNEFKFIELEFRALLNEADLVANPGIRNAYEISHTVTQDDACLQILSESSWLEVEEVCAENLRLIQRSTDDAGQYWAFGLDQINPNPVDASGANINYSVAFDCNTTITIVDTEGRVVATPVNGMIATGGHSVAIPIDELSSGVYFIRMEASAFADTKKLVIEK